MTRLHVAPVHVRYPCGTSLAPRPPSCWQSPCAPSRDTHATKVGDVVGWASHRTVASPACHRRLPLVAQRVAAMTGVMCDEAIQDIATLRRTLLNVFTRARGCGRSGANVQAMGLCDRSWDAVCRPLVVAAYKRNIVTVLLGRIRGFPSRHPTEPLRAFLRRAFHPGIALQGKADLLQGCIDRQLGRVTRSIRVAPQNEIIRTATRPASRRDALHTRCAGASHYT
jgi:hypothetical protein